MLTFFIVLLVIFCVVAIIGGISMMVKGEDFLTWYVGWKAVEGGFEILGYVVLAIIQAAAESNN